eukprot:4541210-Pleurochrysis_carterae.AAC.1
MAAIGARYHPSSATPYTASKITRVLNVLTAITCGRKGVAEAFGALVNRREEQHDRASSW